MVIYSIAPKLKKHVYLESVWTLCNSVTGNASLLMLCHNSCFPLNAVSRLHAQKNRWGWIKFKQALFIFTEIIKQGSMLFYSMLFYSVIGNEESVLGVADAVY